MLRALALADMDAAARIHRAALASAVPHIDKFHTPEEDRWFYRQRMFVECDLIGVFEHGAMVGFIGLRPGWIMQLHVDPGHQRRGCGSALIEMAKAAQPELKAWTFQANAGARAFYEAMGFENIEMTDGADNEEREPDVLYQWGASNVRP
ncbi:GNAT family N-acetyltransferase [Phenylobacterium immobile]|uniref:GNAT family N-acetyltransferase n=1 Tax=Phenylobacterium immobile TaxID=21 RepID=UPI000B1AD650|nr:GNAT family N-acetyltransferase [Phenylobacterium immobile]